MEPGKVRSAGVTAAATLGILESITVMLVWLSYFVSLLNLPVDSRGRHIYEYAPVMFLVLGLVPPLVAAIGIRTAIGLFQLKNWARKAAILWASIALASCLAIIALRPFETFVIPEHVATDVEYLRQLLVISILILFLPTSVWLLFYFRTTGVKAQFQRTHT